MQVAIIPLECNKNIPNINFTNTNHVTLVVNLWLFIHFVYLTINYSHYNAVALFYRLCSKVWMILYCYPDQTHNSYHYLKRRLPEWIKLCLRPVRDKLISKVWRNLRAMINWRRREGTMVDNQTNLLSAISILWNVLYYLWVILYTKVKFSLPTAVSYMLAICVLKFCTGWELTSVLLTVTMISFHCALISYLVFHCCFFHKIVERIMQLVSHINLHGTMEAENEISVVAPISCSDKIHYAN